MVHFVRRKVSTRVYPKVSRLCMFGKCIERRCAFGYSLSHLGAAMVGVGPKFDPRGKSFLFQYPKNGAGLGFSRIAATKPIKST